MVGCSQRKGKLVRDREAVDKVKEGLLQAMVSRPEDPDSSERGRLWPGGCEACLVLSTGVQLLVPGS